VSSSSSGRSARRLDARVAQEEKEHRRKREKARCALRTGKRIASDRASVSSAGSGAMASVEVLHGLCLCIRRPLPGLAAIPLLLFSRRV